MSKAYRILWRYWSVLAAIVLICAAFFTSDGPSRWSAVELLLSFALLIYAWLQLRKRAITIKRKAFLALGLCIPWLASIWVALNVIRQHGYVGDNGTASLLTNMVFWQNLLQQFVFALIFVILFWLIFEWVLRSIARLTE